MFSLRIVASVSLAASVLLASGVGNAQTATIQKTLESKYNLTKPTADRSDIVTAGDVIVLQKDGLLMCGVTTSSPTQNVYKNGKISQNAFNKARFGGFGSLGGFASASSIPTHTFVSGEKFWITSIDTREDGVVFGLISDPINDTRYYATLKIPFNKGSEPPPDSIASMADQVFKVQPADNAAATAKAAPPAAPPPPPMAAIAPPPPPADAVAVPPPTIKLGLTRDEVTAMLGAPTKIIKLSTKEIDIYPDMKVTFVHNKVSDIQ